MKIFNYYDDETLIDRTWYKSSNVIYSECYDKPNDLKEVKIVFTTGRCYLYKDVDVNDYVVFRESSSQGKALNRLIKKKEDGKPFYECVRLEDVDVDKIKEEMENYNSIPIFEIDEESGNFQIKINNKISYSNELGLFKNTDSNNYRKTLFDVLSTLMVNFKIKEIKIEENNG